MRFLAVASVLVSVLTGPVHAQDETQENTILRGAVVLELSPLVADGNFTILEEDDEPGDAFCVYDSADGACTVCPDGEGLDDPCTQSSQPSASDCFSFCPAAGQQAADSCIYNATLGTCAAVTLTTNGTTSVGASVPDGEACAAHCDAN